MPLAARTRRVAAIGPSRWKYGLRADQALRDDPRSRPQPKRPRPVGVDQQHGGRAVGDLRRRARRVQAVVEHRLEPGQRVQAGLAQSLVPVDRPVGRLHRRSSPGRSAPPPRRPRPAAASAGRTRRSARATARDGRRSAPRRRTGSAGRCPSCPAAATRPRCRRSTRSGTRDIASTPQPTPTVIASAAIRPAITCTACCAEPHWASRVRQPVWYGSPACSQAVLVMLLDCSPACVTQPPATCSTASASTPPGRAARSARRRGSRPRAVRTARRRAGRSECAPPRRSPRFPHRSPSDP